MMWVHIWVYNILVDVSGSTHRRDDIKLQAAKVLARQKALVLACIEYVTSMTKASTPIENRHSTACLISMMVFIFFAHVYSFETLYFLFNIAHTWPFQAIYCSYVRHFRGNCWTWEFMKKNFKVAIINRLFSEEKNFTILSFKCYYMRDSTHFKYYINFKTKKVGWWSDCNRR